MPLDRRQFLTRILLGSAGLAAGASLAKLLPKEVTPVVPVFKAKWYKWRPDFPELPPYPDNIKVRAESKRLLNSFKNQYEYNQLFLRAAELHYDLNDDEAGWLARHASRKFPKGWKVPKNVILLSCMLTAYGIRYADEKEAVAHALPCRKHSTLQTKLKG